MVWAVKRGEVKIEEEPQVQKELFFEPAAENQFSFVLPCIQSDQSSEWSNPFHCHTRRPV